MSINKLLFFVGILFIPFYNDFPLFPDSHLLRSPSNIFFAVLIYINFIIKRGKVTVDNKHLIFLGALVFVIFLSSIINSIRIEDYNVRFTIKVFVVLFFFLLVSINSYIQINKINYKIFSKYVVIAFIPVIIYSYIEIGDRIFQINIFQQLNDFVEPLLHERIYKQGARVRGFAFEPSYFSLVLGFIFPWLLYYVEKVNKGKYLLIFFMIILYFTYSRGAYLIITIQIILFVLLNRINGAYQKHNIKFAFGIILVSILFIPVSFEILKSLLEYEPNNVSNIIRFSSLVASINLGFNYPFLGVGLGQSGFYIQDYYPELIWSAYNASNWVNADTDMGSPTFSFLPSLFADLGFLGTFTFLAFWLYPLKRSVRLIRIKKARSIDTILIILNIGLLVGSFGVDSFTFIGYWIMLGISYSRHNYLKKIL